MTRYVRVFFLLALLSLIWAPVNLIVEAALGAGLSPIGIGLFRWSGVAVAFAALTRIPAIKRRFNLASPSSRDYFLSVTLGVLLTGPAHLFYYIALVHTQSVEGTVFNTTAPLWTALFAGIILREQVGWRRWVALAFGTAGAYITAVGFAAPALHANHAGLNALYLLGTLMESVTGVLIAGLVRRSSGLTVFGAESVGMALTFVVAAFLVPGSVPGHLMPPVGSWLPLAYLVVLAGVFAFGAWSTLVERTPLSLMVLSLAIQPPIAAVAAYFARGERPNLNVGLGAALVVVALAIAVVEPSSDRGLGRLLRSSTLGRQVSANQIDCEAQREYRSDEGGIHDQVAILEQVRQESAEG